MIWYYRDSHVLALSLNRRPDTEPCWVCISTFVFHAVKVHRFHDTSFIYLFCQWTLGCSQPFCFHKQCCYEQSHPCLLEHMPRVLWVELLDFRACTIFNLTDIAKWFSKVAVPLYSSTRQGKESQLLHTTNTWGCQTCTLSHMAMSNQRTQKPSFTCWHFSLSSIKPVKATSKVTNRT